MQETDCWGAGGLLMRLPARVRTIHKKLDRTNSLILCCLDWSSSDEWQWNVQCFLQQMVAISWWSVPAVVWLTAPAPVHLGTDQIQHIELSPMLITTASAKEDMMPTLITSTVELVQIYKNTHGTDLIYTGLDVVQNQYQDRF